MYVFFEVFGDFWKRGWNPVPTPKSLKNSLVVTQNVVALPKTTKKHLKKTSKKLKKQIHYSTINTHTNKKKLSTKKNITFHPFTLILTLQPPSTPHQLNPFSTNLLVLRGLFRWRIAGITGVAGSLVGSWVRPGACGRNVASRLMILLMEEILLTSWGWRDLYTIPGEKTRRITVRTINVVVGTWKKGFQNFQKSKAGSHGTNLFQGNLGRDRFLLRKSFQNVKQQWKKWLRISQFLTGPI